MAHHTIAPLDDCWRRLLAVLFAIAAVACPAPAFAIPREHPEQHQFGYTSRWLPPLASPHIVNPFEPPPEPWLSGHRGVDLAAELGAAILAPSAGTVTFAGPVAGRGVVVIAHDNGLRSSLEPVVGLVPVGARVSSAMVVATLDAVDGHCTPAACLHWGVRLGNVYIDPFVTGEASPPIILLPATSQPPHLMDTSQTTSKPANGRLSPTELCPVDSASHVRLRCDAARQFDALNSAFAAEFGHHLSVTSAYRPIATQWTVKAARGDLAAAPGTSNHGWGTAVDIATGPATGATYRWLRKHGPAYGWHNPAWARPLGTKPEPWHWEFRSIAPPQH